jgi:hypothetical protein
MHLSRASLSMLINLTDRVARTEQDEAGWCITSVVLCVCSKVALQGGRWVKHVEIQHHGG